MIDKKISRFLDEFDEISHRVSMARERDFARLLRTWFACLDEAPEIIAREVNRLQELENWDTVSSHVMTFSGSMVGSGQLNWPDDKHNRLGGQLLLLRKLASEEMRVMQFSFDYFYSGDNNIDSNVNEMASLFFLPHTEELRRRLEDVCDDVLDTNFYVPASDRVVELDHNSVSFDLAVSALHETLQHLRDNNSIEAEDKGRIETEINSGLALMKAPRTRIEAAGVVILGALKWLADRFASALVGAAAGRAIAAIRALLGF